MNSAGWLAASSAARISAMRLVTPGEVSVVHHAHRLDRVCLVFRKAGFDRRGRRYDANRSISLTCTNLSAIFSPQAREMSGSTSSARGRRAESVLTSAASQAPVPEGIDHHRVRRLEYVSEAFDYFQAEVAEPGSAVVDGGRSIARSTRSGTLVGPEFAGNGDRF
jgi:hypothetical protein